MGRAGEREGKRFSFSFCFALLFRRFVSFRFVSYLFNNYLFVILTFWDPIPK